MILVGSTPLPDLETGDEVVYSNPLSPKQRLPTQQQSRSRSPLKLLGKRRSPTKLPPRSALSLSPKYRRQRRGGC